MLTYVFWHWRKKETDLAAYEAHLIQFHQQLSENKPSGFQHSVVFKVNKLPWLEAATEVYEDWYILDDSAALDSLNEAAVSGSRKQSHDAAAKCAAGGTAGLYRFRNGKLYIADAEHSMRLSKPAHLAYDDFYEQLQPTMRESRAGLWGRQMTLGPGPEFCLLAPTPMNLPPGFESFSIPVKRIWTSI